MTLSGYELATDAQFREVSNFATPPRAGRVTAIEPSGQVRVETDDPDGGDVLAWPLNGFSYAVNDVVYLAFAVNSPDSAIVIGSLAPLPTLDSEVLPDPLIVEEIWARDGDGLTLADDAGTLALFVEDGGAVGVNTTNPGGASDAMLTVRSNLLTHNSNTIAYIMALNRYNSDTASWYLATENNSAPFNAVLVANNANMKFGVDLAGTYTNLMTLIGQSGAGNYGFLGIGADAPQGKVHAHDSTGGMLFVTKSAINATAQTILPNGAGDVTAGLYFMAVIVTSGGALFGTSNVIALNSNLNIYSSGSDTLNLRVNADGSVDIRRTGGSLTYTVSLFMIWR